MRVTGNEWQGKDVENGGVRFEVVAFFEREISFFDEDAAHAGDADILFDLRIVLSERGAGEGGGVESTCLVAVITDIGMDAVDAVCIDVKAVVAPFVHDVEGDEKADGEPEGQTEDIDGG